ncbi:thiamine biosynthesis lipoprotein [Pustulibacterium marinum]|uniref:FAD:protein FMN transferase n=2 Tax=Pustulibacterium marinum TaxID=1224947 RepID=A0A1I7G3W9_9FLAO|nr:thiamine biosynthesis lipoprotein [Pustulibacterium marinum]
MTKMPQTAYKHYIAQTRFLFHCHIKVKIPATYPEALLNDCFAMLEAIDLQYNSYQEDSLFHQINTNAGQWVSVDEVTISLLKQTIKISELTHGSYDITAMPLIRLWGFYKENIAQIPTKEAIQNCLTQVDFSKIQIDGNRVKIEEHQELITGSFIKAYAVDQVIAMLKAQGVTDAIINAGGSTIYALTDAFHEKWNIHIPHPKKETNLAKIPLSNRCFSLSACKHQFIAIEGKKYSHILNTNTGYPAANLQVGLLSDSACLGDMLSTALFGIEAKNFQETIQRLQKVFNFEAYLIDENQHLHQHNFKSLLPC